MPLNDTDTHQVRDSINPSEVFGRIVAVRENTPQECITVYCRLHQCKKMISLRPAPSSVQMRRWFQAGIGLTRGKAGQREHLEKWKPSAVEEAA